MDFSGVLSLNSEEDVGRKAFKLRKVINDFQETFTVIEKVSQKLLFSYSNRLLLTKNISLMLSRVCRVPISKI